MRRFDDLGLGGKGSVASRAADTVTVNIGVSRDGRQDPTASRDGRHAGSRQISIEGGESTSPTSTSSRQADEACSLHTV